MRRDVPHIEEGKRREKRGKRKPQKKKFPAGREFVKQKKDGNTSRDSSGKVACRAEEDRIFIIREKRDAKRV